MVRLIRRKIKVYTRHILHIRNSASLVMTILSCTVTQTDSEVKLVPSCSCKAARNVKDIFCSKAKIPSKSRRKNRNINLYSVSCMRPFSTALKFFLYTQDKPLHAPFRRFEKNTFYGDRWNMGVAQLWWQLYLWGFCIWFTNIQMNHKHDCSSNIVALILCMNWFEWILVFWS